MRFRIGLPRKNTSLPPALLDHEAQGLRQRLEMSRQQNEYLEGQLAGANERLALLQRALNLIQQGAVNTGLQLAESGDEKRDLGEEVG